MTPEEIITDAEVERVHGHANFGAMTKRAVVDEGVLSYALGYSTGSTMMAIVREHGLITRPKGYSASLTKKGQRYLQAMFSGIPLSRIAAMRTDAPEIARRYEEMVKALKRVAINEHLRATDSGGFVNNGYSCELCRAESKTLAELVHKPTCALNMARRP